MRQAVYGFSGADARASGVSVLGTTVTRPRQQMDMSRTTPIGWLPPVPGARWSRVT
jgi:hypothetical protein